MCLSKLPGCLLPLFVCGLTIGTTHAIAQGDAKTPKSVEIERCRVLLLDEVMLASGVPGVLDFVLPEEGDIVKADETIVGIKADVMEAQQAIALKEAQNDVEVRYSQKAYELAEAEYQKALEANRRLPGTVAAVEIDRLRLASERAQLQIEQAEHQLDVANLRANEAEANVQAYQIQAPFTGVVTGRFKSRGEAVRQGDPILELKSTSRVRVEGYISVEDMFRIKQGDPVKVQLVLENADLEIEKKELDGVLKFVALSVETVTQKVRVWAEVQNPDAILRAGLTAKMTILPKKRGTIQTTQLAR